MMQPGTGATRADTPPTDPSQATTGELFGALTDQVTQLVREEVRLAQSEAIRKAKRYGFGAGILAGAGLFALMGVSAWVTAAVFGLSSAVSGWIAGIVVGVALFLIAGGLALIGRKGIQQAGSPLPTETIASVQADVATVKEGLSR